MWGLMLFLFLFLQGNDSAPIFFEGNRTSGNFDMFWGTRAFLAFLTHHV